jgi:hypothetical protein
MAEYGVITVSSDALHHWDTAVDDAVAAINNNNNPKKLAHTLTMLHVRTLQVVAYFMSDLIIGAPHNPCAASQGSCQCCTTSIDYQALPLAILVLLVLVLLLPLVLLVRVRNSPDECQYRKRVFLLPPPLLHSTLTITSLLLSLVSTYFYYRCRYHSLSILSVTFLICYFIIHIIVTTIVTVIITVLITRIFGYQSMTLMFLSQGVCVIEELSCGKDCDHTASDAQIRGKQVLRPCECLPSEHDMIAATALNLIIPCT